MKSGHQLRHQATSGRQGKGSASFWRIQLASTRLSYAAALIGVLLAVHDFHHPQDRFGYSTPVLGAAIMLYLLGLNRRH